MLLLFLMGLTHYQEVFLQAVWFHFDLLLSLWHKYVF